MAGVMYLLLLGFLVHSLYAGVVYQTGDNGYGDPNTNSIRPVGLKGYLTIDCVDSVNGRQVLILSLLQGLNRPYWYPTFDDKVQLYLPESLRSADQPASIPNTAIVLPDIQIENSIIYREQLLHVARKTDCLKVGREEMVSSSSQKFQTSVSAIVSLTRGFQTYVQVLSFLVVIRDQCNQLVFAAAVQQIIQSRSDLPTYLPDLASLYPQEFFPVGYLGGEGNKHSCACLPEYKDGNCVDIFKGRQWCYSSAGCHDATKSKSIDAYWSFDACTEPKQVGKYVEITWNKPPFKTLPDSDPESLLGYWREDPTLNSHFGSWFQRVNAPATIQPVFGFYSMLDYPQDSRDGSSKINRSGEIVYAHHKNLIGRYSLERISNGLPRIEVYGPLEWSFPVPIGYNSKLKHSLSYGISGLGYLARPDNSVFRQDWMAEIMERSALTMLASIKDKQLYDHLGGVVPLGAEGGRDLGINDFMNAFTSSYTDSVNQMYYGDMMHQSYIFLGLMRSVFEGNNITQFNLEGGINALYSPNTCLRDPLFYRFNKCILNAFSHYKASLPMYTDAELEFPGVEIHELTFQSTGAHSANHLITFMEKSEIGLTGLDFDDLGEPAGKGLYKNPVGSIVRYERLNHLPWDYKVKIHSEEETAGFFRLFLIPDTEFVTNYVDDVVEIDKWPILLQKGTKVYTRNPSTTPFTREPMVCKDWPCSYQENLVSGFGYNTTEDIFHVNCGIPQNLMLPRGSAAGSRFRMFGMVSQFLENDEALLADWSELSKYAWGSCGTNPGVPYPDSRPMGFPFDRVPICPKMDSYSHSDDECYGHDSRAYSNGRSNIILQDVIIKHVNSTTHTPTIHTHTSPYMAKKEGEEERLTY